MSISAGNLLKDSSVVVSIGPRPRSQRSAIKIATGALVLVAGIWLPMTSMAQTSGGQTSTSQSSQQMRYQQQVLEQQQQRIPARVVSVRSYSPPTSRSQRETSRAKDRTSSLVGEVIGSLVGGVLAHKVGGGDGRYIASAAGSIAGAYVGGVVQDKMTRKLESNGSGQYGNATFIEEYQKITVSIDIPGVYKQMEIIQPVGPELNRGDYVYLEPRDGGQNIAVVPRDQPALNPYRGSAYNPL